MKLIPLAGDYRTQGSSLKRGKWPPGLRQLHGKEPLPSPYPSPKVLIRAQTMMNEDCKTRLMATIRVLHDKLAALCRNNYKVGRQVCMDEQLVVFRGHCPFRVYIPSKPDKYGMKVWACCDVDSAYITNFVLYTGITGRGCEVGQGSRVVLQMTEHRSGSGRGCTVDNFFTSSDLAHSMLNRQITLCGTVKKNRRFLPPAILDVHSRPVQSSKFVFHDDMTLVSYVPKKKKNVVLLSTQHHDAEVHEDREDKKPEIILHYNRTKGAVDTLDKLLRTYSCQRKCRRWPQVFFGNLVDIAAYNAFVIFLFCFPEFMERKSYRRRLYLEKLAFELSAALPALENRIGRPLNDVAPAARPFARSTSGWSV